MFQPRIRKAVLAGAGVGVLAIGAAQTRANIVINPTYTSAITSSPNAAAMETGIGNAIAEIESYITNPITVNIQFDNINFGLGQNDSSQVNIAYSQYRADLLAHQVLSANDNMAIAHLPNTTTEPVTGSTTIQITLPLARALGETALGNNGGGFDGMVGLNFADTNLLRTGPQDPTKYDLQEVAMHEISEVLDAGGFGSNIDFGPVPAPLDLYRFSANGVRSYTDLAPSAYFSIDGGATKIDNFNQDPSGDFGDWLRGSTPEVQDAFATPGVQVDLGSHELVAFDVLGYNVAVPEPGICAMMLLASGTMLLRRKRV